MFSGLLLVLAGILIYLHPRILVALMSGCLILFGVGLMVMHWKLRKVYKAWDQASNPWARFIIRF